MGSLKKRKEHNTEIHFLYDTEDRLHTVVNEAGKRYSFDYNKRGEIIRETGFDGVQSQFERDATGNIIKVVRPGGRFIQYEYDANDRLIRVEYHDGSWQQYSYDRSGNLQEAINEY